MATGSDGAYLGCFVDSGNRDLRVKEFVENGMSVEVCGGLCREQGARYFGLEEGRVCLCGNSYGRYGPAPTKDCNVPCPGNSSETCGAQWRSSVYRVAAAPALPLVSSAQGGYLGCFFDSGNRDLRVKEFVENGMSVEVCAGLCREQGAQYAGLEEGRVCLCGNSYGRYGPAPAKDCNVPCPGNSKQTCGAQWRSSVYRVGAAPALPPVSSAQGGYLGCFFDSGNRDLRVKEFVENGMSVEVCAGLCREQGAQYAGLEDGRVCLCGNSYGRYGSAPAKDCNVPCPGNSKQTCGAPWRSSVYKIAR